MSRNHRVGTPNTLEAARTDIFTALREYTEICHEQPRPASAPILDFEHVRPVSRASRPSQWIAESRNLASRASRRASP